MYQGVCTICKADNIIATYEGECGDSGVARAGEHRDAIANRDEKNAFAKHISNFHPERAGDTSVIKIKVVKTFKKCLERQVSGTDPLTVLASFPPLPMVSWPRGSSLLCPRMLLD